MIVDTSALMAVLLSEPEATQFGALLEIESSMISAATMLEAEIVARGRRGEALVRELHSILDEAAIIAVDERQARIAGEAYRRYGRGSKHPAKLNFGDCFSYALAMARDEPLLFKGDDFIHTDVRVAAP